MDLRNSVILTEQGYFVSEKWARLNELLQSFDEYLELHWIPTDKRIVDEKNCYRIIHNPPPTSKMAPYVVMYAKESDEPEELLARIISGDNWNGDVQGRFDARIKAKELFRKKAYEDELREASDLAHFLLIRAGNYTTIRNSNGELVKFDSHRFRLKTPVARRKRK